MNIHTYLKQAMFCVETLLLCWFLLDSVGHCSVTMMPRTTVSLKIRMHRNQPIVGVGHSTVKGDLRCQFAHRTILRENQKSAESIRN